MPIIYSLFSKIKQKFYEKYPDLYWNLVAGSQLIKAPSLFFEYYQNNYSIAEALRVIEFEEATKPQKPSSIVDHVTTFIRTNSDIFKPGEKKVPKLSSFGLMLMSFIDKQFAILYQDFLKKTERLRMEFESFERTRRVMNFFLFIDEFIDWYYFII